MEKSIAQGQVLDLNDCKEFNHSIKIIAEDSWALVSDSCVVIIAAFFAQKVS